MIYIYSIKMLIVFIIDFKFFYLIMMYRLCVKIDLKVYYYVSFEYKELVISCKFI